MGLGALALGGAFVGLSMVERAHEVATFTYMSDDILAKGASLEAEPAVRNEQSRFITQMRGQLFTERSSNGTRVWRLVDSTNQWEPARFG